MSVPSLINLGLVAAGGACGSVVRYLLQNAAADRMAVTAAINIAGSFIIGVVFVLLSRYEVAAVRLSPLLVGGFLGGFTTYSAFALDFATALRQGMPARAWMCVAVTVAGALLACCAGMYICDKVMKILS